jgi:hypothetical protein
VYPCGTLSSEGGYLSAFIEVAPDVTWASSWALADVAHTIEVINHTGKLNQRKGSPHTFSDKSPDQGYHDLIKGDTWQEFRDAGWLNSKDEICFRCSVSGNLGQDQPLVPDLSGSARMWIAQKFTDVVVSASGVVGFELHCHRPVLASASPVLDRMLSNAMQEGAEGKILFSDMSAEDVHTFMLFIYVNKLPALANFTELLRLADMYQMPDLARHCIAKLVGCMTKATLIQTLESLCLHKASVSDDEFEMCWSKIKKDKEQLRLVARYLMRDESKTAFRQLVADSIMASNATLDTVVCPLLTKEVALQHL